MAGDQFFGGATGTRAALEDDLATLNVLSSADLRGAQTAMVPFQAREHKAKAEHLELENEQNRKFNELLMRTAQNPDGSGGQGGQPQSMSGQLNSLAGIAMRAGLVNKGMELGKAASLIGSREATQAAQQAHARVQYLVGVQKDAELTGQLFGGVTDQDSLDRANALYTFQTGRQSPIAGVPFDPNMIADFNRQAISAKDRAAQEQRKTRDAAIERFRQDRLDQHDEEAAQREERLQMERDREDRLAKGGGGRGVTSPSNMELEAAKRTITKSFQNLDPTDTKDASYAIASEARAIRRANPGINPDVAIQQAYNNMVNSGDLENTSKGTFGMGKKDSYIRGKRPETAQPVPTKKEDLVEGRYYVNPAGMVAKWTGKGFEPVQSARGALPARRPSPGIDPSLIDPEDDVETGDPDDDADD